MRSVSCPAGPEEVDNIKNANFMVRQSAKLCVLMERLGGWWSSENPLRSLLWRMPEIARLQDRAFRVRYDACQLGASIPGEGPFMKPTLLLTNAGWRRCLGRRCPREHVHVHLEGQVKIKGRWLNRTGFAAEYS